MPIEELLKKLGFARCGETNIFQISLGGAIGVHLDAIQAMTTLELHDHINAQLDTLKTNLIMHLDGTSAQLRKLTSPDYGKYQDLM